MKKYTFSIQRTDEYIFEIEAETREQADKIFSEKEIGEEDAKKNLEIITHFLGEDDIESDEEQLDEKIENEKLEDLKADGLMTQNDLEKDDEDCDRTALDYEEPLSEEESEGDLPR